MLRALGGRVLSFLAGGVGSIENVQARERYRTDEAVEEFVSTVATYSVLDCELQNLTAEYEF